MTSGVPLTLQHRIRYLFLGTPSLQDSLEARKLINKYCKRGSLLVPAGNTPRREPCTLDLYDFLNEFLYSHVFNVLRAGEKAKDENVLQYYAEQWEKYRNSSKFLHDAFSFPNRSYLKRRNRDAQEGMYAAYHLAVVTWYDHLFLKLHERVTKTILKLFERDRKNESVDMNFVPRVVRSYVELGSKAVDDPMHREVDLGCYEEYFEKAFLEDTERFYTGESAQFMKKVGASITKYTVKANQWLQEESDRVRKYLHETTHNKLMATCKNAFVARYVDCLYAEVPHLLAAGDEENLEQMHSLLSRVEPAEGQLKSLKHVSFMVVWKGLRSAEEAENSLLDYVFD